MSTQKQIFDLVSLFCSKNITKSYSTSFSFAIKLLKKEYRDAIYSIYGFVRLADEIVDTFHDYDKKTLLNELRNETINALAMASPFTIEEKQVLLEAKNLDVRKTKIAEILTTYSFDQYNNTTVQ